ncbi:MAG: calcium-binding protein, partial [Bacteroidota bacterium]
DNEVFVNGRDDSIFNVEDFLIFAERGEVQRFRGDDQDNALYIADLVGSREDNVNGAGGDDVLETGDGRDILIGGDGDDTLRGNSGDDLLQGGADNDSLFGDNDNDTLEGGAGDDTLSGGNGDDSIDGGSGGETTGDVLTVGGPRDRFALIDGGAGTIIIVDRDGTLGRDTVTNVETLRFTDGDVSTTGLALGQE